MSGRHPGGTSGEARKSSSRAALWQLSLPSALHSSQWWQEAAGSLGGERSLALSTAGVVAASLA